jgi:hypothetical protein
MGAGTAYPSVTHELTPDFHGDVSCQIKPANTKREVVWLFGLNFEKA